MPRVRLAPRGVDSLADEAVFLSSSYGLTPEDWQEDILDCWLCLRRDGRWAAATCGLAVPRQNGKNAVIEVRELYGMVELGEKILHTAHEVKTARKAFIRICSFFENEREYPELAALVKEIRKTNGQEAIFLTNGGSIEFIARSRGSGRGFTVDVLVCDEAQDLTDDELAALLPTISAAPLGNPQVILTGTPPDPEKPSQGEVFARVRDDGEQKRDPRLCWIDFGIADGPISQIAVDDKTLWYVHNPALGGRLQEAEVVRERRLMSARKFAAERLGWWGDPDEADEPAAIDFDTWRQRRAPNRKRPAGEVVIAVDVNPYRTRSAIAIVGEGRKGRPRAEVETGDGVEWIVPRLVKLTERRDVVEIALHPASQAGALLTALKKAELEDLVEHLSLIDVGQACAGLQEAVANGEFEYLEQQDLDEAVKVAHTRQVGEAQVFDRKNHDDEISPVVAVANAVHRYGLLGAYDIEDSVL